jgi:precorrin-6A/cobalt-precorrin-6A reductase
MRDTGVRAVVDATHPFAAQITPNAHAAAADEGIPHLRLTRPEWVDGPGDDWTRVPTIDAAAAVVGGRRVFLTTGRQDVSAFADVADSWFLIRVVDPPERTLPPHHEVLRSRGPYTLDGEVDLMRRHRIEIVVTKNSGGSLTSAKLTAARELGLPVIVVDRPAEPDGMQRVSTVGGAVEWLHAQL